MTDKLTTAEVRFAATTNEDLTLSQFKRIGTGFDEWLERIKAEARAEGAAKALDDAVKAGDYKKAIKSGGYLKGNRNTRKRRLQRARKKEHLEASRILFSDLNEREVQIFYAAAVLAEEISKKPKKKSRSRNRKVSVSTETAITTTVA